MARQHGSQCGFCTPGIVMSLFAHYQECDGRHEPRRTQRCAGGKSVAAPAIGRSWTRRSKSAASRPTIASCAILRRGCKRFVRLTTRPIVFVGDAGSFFAAPASEQSLAQLYAQHPDATIVAGATDVGLWITKKLMPLEKIIHVGRVAELSGIEESAERLCARRDRVAFARRSGARFHRSRYRGGAAAVRLLPGARRRHRWWQHRQRLADRRSAATADRTRRHGRIAPRRPGARIAARKILH